MSGTAHRRITLAGSVIGAVLVALDGTVLTVAQPALGDDLGAGLGQVQWTSTAYLITVASLLVFAGRLGDRYGHRRLFGYGMLGFAVASAGVGLAPDIGVLIGLRVVQGVCGALLQPATLGMLRAAFPADRLGPPIAARTAAIGLAAAAGPVVGGVLTAHFGWRSVFFLGVPPALVIAVLVLLVRDPEAADASREQPVGLDPLGALLLGCALAGLVTGLVSLPDATVAVPALVGAVVAGALLVRHERRAPSPLLSPAVIAAPVTATSLAILLTASAALFGALFSATYFLQDVQHLDALATALRMLPAALCMVLAAPLGAVLLRRHGARTTTAGGLALLALGVLAFGRLTTDASGLTVGACALAMGAGFGTVMVTATEVLVRRAPRAHAGVAGGLQQTAMNIGPTLGVAVATMLLVSPADAASPDTFTASMRTTLTVLALLTALAAAAALRRLPARAPLRVEADVSG
ncbi:MULTISPECIES: MFS transporter [Streptomyces]|uniref:MFS transporter n=1 Tax=Streptomyces xanthii TaxID=2768069 RepID=A0A7H1B1M9_9ACTN|nr:MFS transporter [Streptomyces xanthii]QNS02634.1 MFS transporter [Streptomyces xanthii]